MKKMGHEMIVSSFFVLAVGLILSFITMDTAFARQDASDFARRSAQDAAIGSFLATPGSDSSLDLSGDAGSDDIDGGSSEGFSLQGKVETARLEVLAGPVGDTEPDFNFSAGIGYSLDSRGMFIARGELDGAALERRDNSGQFENVVVQDN